MKKKLLILSFLVLMITASFSQKSEEGQFFDVPIATYPISGWVNRIDTVPGWWSSQDFRQSPFVAAAPSLGCSDRDRRIRKMLIDVECDDITPDELGYDCDECIDLGDHVAFTLRFVFPSSTNGGRTVWLDPLTAVTPGNQRRTHFIGWIPDSIISRIPLGAEFRLKWCE